MKNVMASKLFNHNDLFMGLCLSNGPRSLESAMGLLNRAEEGAGVVRVRYDDVLQPCVYGPI